MVRREIRCLNARIDTMSAPIRAWWEKSATCGRERSKVLDMSGLFVNGVRAMLQNDARGTRRDAGTSSLSAARIGGFDRWLRTVGITLAPTLLAILAVTLGMPQAFAASTPSGTPSFKIVSVNAANFDPTIVQPYLVKTAAPVASCRLGLFVIAPGAVSLLARANLAVLDGSAVSIVYSKDTDGFCVVSAIADAPPGSTPQVTSASSSGASGSVVPMSDGYANPYVTSFKAGFRDFGQGKLDEKIDPISGKLTLEYTDLLIPGPNGLDISVKRVYSSPNPGAIYGNTLEPNFNGFGWRGQVSGLSPSHSIGHS